MKKLNLQTISTLALASALAALLPMQAFAQQSDEQPSSQSPDDSSSDNDREIIVTGTLLRGISPPGSQTLAVTKEDALATGATSTAQLLANVPQIGDFNARPINRGVFNTQQTVNHPDLRNLGAAVLGGGGSATLLLLDGHRLPGMGVRQTIPDSDAIPPGAIERVEIVTDGGSAIYGADAVGGVVNYITRKRFDGVEARATYGFAPDYKTASVDTTVGRQWDTGSLWATYSFNWHDAIFGRDRDYVQARDWVLGVPLDLTCTPGNVIATAPASGGNLAVTTIYSLPNLTPGIGNRCDNQEDQTIYPRERRHSALVGLNQELSDNLEIDIKAFFTNRRNFSDGGPLTGSVTIAANNPLYRSTGDANATRNQIINLNFNSIRGASTAQTVELTTYGIANTLTWKLGGDWRVTGLFNYGYGESEVENDAVNTTLLQSLITAGTVNPYNLGAASNAAALAPVLDWSNYGLGRNELINYRAVADGTLFSLPGGDVKLAVGGEYLIEDFRVTSGVNLKSNLRNRPRFHVHRNTKAAFGEVFVPIFGEGNRTPGLYSLAVSAAGRYDDYSDFGGTFNPKFALTWEPVDWVKLRGNWSKSFQAPSLADGAAAAINSITVLPIVITPSPTKPPIPGQVSVFVSGGGGNLKPQKATIYSFGGDINLPFIPGLSLSATYYNIKFKDLIAIPPVTSTLLYTAYPSLVQLNPLTTAQLQAFAALAPLNNSALTPYFSRPQDVYFLVDGRRANFSSVVVSGLDFSARYELATSFGSVFVRTAGNYVLKRKESPVAGQPFINTRDNFTRLRVSSTLGTTIGNLRGQVTWLHSGGFDVIPTAANLQQSRVASYDVFNLFFQYQFDGEGVMEDLALTLNVDNVFDNDPPLFRGPAVNGGGAGNANGFTLGRLFQFGISKKF